MVFRDHHAIDQLALPEIVPRVGDNLSRLFNSVPPKPYRSSSSLRPIHLTPTDFHQIQPVKASIDAALAKPSPRGSRDVSVPAPPPPPLSPRRTDIPAQLTQRTTYARFYERDRTGPLSLLNDPHCHLSGRKKMARGSGNILGSMVESAEEVARWAAAAEKERSIPAVPPPPPTPPPPPPPPITYAERMITQATLEEQVILERMTARARRMSLPQPAIVVDADTLRHNFLCSEGSVSPRRPVAHVA